MLSDDQSRVNLPERYLVRYAAVCWQTGVLYSPSSPQRILGLADVARYLSGHYVTITVKRFPDGEYSRFKQILLLAQRRQAYAIPSKEDVEAIQALAQDVPLTCTIVQSVKLVDINTLDSPITIRGCIVSIMER